MKISLEIIRDILPVDWIFIYGIER